MICMFLLLKLLFLFLFIVKSLCSDWGDINGFIIIIISLRVYINSEWMILSISRNIFIFVSTGNCYCTIIFYSPHVNKMGYFVLNINLAFSDFICKLS